MCVVGSYVAWIAGGVVLGGFTLFLTFCIGIRFLIKPDTSPQDPTTRGARLDARGIGISLFFGLTIGFGTGFVGSGGGMMMLVVFTAFLGMELKAAVGTSTFIMTFTALIASISHIIIYPTILLERGGVLLLCVVVATLSSLVSARFANRMPARTVGKTTGIVLTSLGASMLLLRYGSPTSLETLPTDTLTCLVRLVTYLAPCVCVVVALHAFAHVPKLVFRKILHVVAFSCVTLMIVVAASWQAAALASCVVAGAVYPVLDALEGQTWYAGLFVQKSAGEVKRSMLMLFLMFAGVVSVAWGMFDKPALAAASILMWGVGDAAAALVGTTWGRHIVRLPLADGKKTWEGSVAMFVASFAVGMAVLCYGGYPAWSALLMSAAGGLAGAAVELLSPSEYDTVTVPVAVLAMLLVL
jgi:dolichol kinase